MVLGRDGGVFYVGDVGEDGGGCCEGEEGEREEDGVFAEDVFAGLGDVAGEFLESC